MEGKRQKVMVVEPSGDWRDLITFVLGGCGYDVVNVRACNVVAQAATVRPDVILLDLAMTEPDGDPILQRLKTSPLTRAIPIITETVRGEEERGRQAIDGGAAEVLYKPFDLSDLPFALERNLRLER
jgi:CheY-like chemotaxis protein